VITARGLPCVAQGFSEPKARQQIIARFMAFPLLNPDRDDHIAAAELRNLCRKHGVQAGTIDALLAHLCIRVHLRKGLINIASAAYWPGLKLRRVGRLAATGVIAEPGAVQLAITAAAPARTQKRCQSCRIRESRLRTADSRDRIRLSLSERNRSPERKCRSALHSLVQQR